MDCLRCCCLASPPFYSYSHTPSQITTIHSSKHLVNPLVLPKWKSSDTRKSKREFCCVAANCRSQHTSYEFRRETKTNKVEKHVRTLLIDNYDSYTYNLYQLLAVINGVGPVVVKNDELSWMDIEKLLYEDRAFDNIVISPGPGSPLFDADIGICMEVLQRCHDIPILGVCMGHEALGYANGAQIVHAPEPVHGRLSEVEHCGCPLFDNIPSGTGSGFKVVRYHSLMLDADSLPEDLIPTAWTVSSDCSDSVGCSTYFKPLKSRTHSPVSEKQTINGGASVGYTGTKFTKVIMAISHQTRPHYGIQFHPESIATAHGERLLENFRNLTTQFWQQSLYGDKTKDLPSSSYSNMRTVHDSLLLDANAVSVNGLEASASAKNEVMDAIPDRKRGVLRVYWEKLDGFATQVGGSEMIFYALFGNGAAKDTFWLDSSCQQQGRARFSFMGGEGGPLWKCLTYQLSDNKEISRGIGALKIEDSNGFAEERQLEEGFFKFLSNELESWISSKKDQEGLPFDFCGGFVGYLGYELKVECGARFNFHKSQLPDACFFFVDRFLAVDHSNGDVYVVALYDEHLMLSTFEKDSLPLFEEPLHEASIGAVSSKGKAKLWVKEVVSRLLCVAESGINVGVERIHSTKSVSPPAMYMELDNQFSAQKCKSQYVEDVVKCLGYIRDGESYELCLTTQMTKRMGLSDTLGLYLTLREMNPAPYAAWLHFGREDVCICCSSPERFLRLDQSGVLEAKPIKGTLRRGSSSKEDEQLKWELQNSEKDQAENLMIVDLLRNDLGRVCKPGSVHVPSLMAVESYATVHTLVSTIRGKKRDDVTPIECVRAAFPGGSMTGAPKLRAMELLDSLECGARGVYSGAIGFFSINSSFDLNIVIRTLVIQKGMASIGAGGAVVALSDPEDEYEEMLLKAKIPIRAVTELESVSNLWRGKRVMALPARA